MISDLRDTDLTDAITRFQQLQTALEANLRTAGRLQSLTLLNFLS
jgi:flagellin-like hook-associated protein FlgL